MCERASVTPLPSGCDDSRSLDLHPTPKASCRRSPRHGEILPHLPPSSLLPAKLPLFTLFGHAADVGK
nr:hypothetical protein HmN_000551400 [Hymenolepis microstoma]